MISNDLANLADCLSRYALHSSGPSPETCSRISAELLKLAHTVAKIEGMPIVKLLLELELRREPELQFVRSSIHSEDPEVG